MLCLSIRYFCDFVDWFVEGATAEGEGEGFSHFGDFGGFDEVAFPAEDFVAELEVGGVFFGEDCYGGCVVDVAGTHEGGGDEDIEEAVHGATGAVFFVGEAIGAADGVVQTCGGFEGDVACGAGSEECADFGGLGECVADDAACADFCGSGAA